MPSQMESMASSACTNVALLYDSLLANSAVAYGSVERRVCHYPCSLYQPPGSSWRPRQFARRRCFKSARACGSFASYSRWRYGRLGRCVCLLSPRAVRNTRGQATVEAAFCIPVLFVLLCLLLQPSILLYDRMVMNAAAAEACRLLVTRSDLSGIDEQRCIAIVKRHLGAVPPVDIFHVHNSGCTWQIELTGDENASEVSVRISTQVKLLPFAGFTASLAGLAGSDGCMQLEVEYSQATQPPWVEQPDPSGWATSRM